MKAKGKVKTEFKFKKLVGLPKDPNERRKVILGEVIRLIEEEPRRFNYKDWLLKRRKNEDWGEFASRGHGIDLDYTEEAKKKAAKLAPSCETIGCVAGWVAVLVKPRVKESDSPRSIAAKALKIDPNSEAAEELFIPEGMDDLPPSGTRAHARAAIRHIKKWLKRVEKGELKTEVERPEVEVCDCGYCN